MGFKQKGAAFDFLCLEGATFLGPAGVSDMREPGRPGMLSTDPVCLGARQALIRTPVWGPGRLSTGPCLSLTS